CGRYRKRSTGCGSKRHYKGGCRWISSVTSKRLTGKRRWLASMTLDNDSETQFSLLPSPFFSRLQFPRCPAGREKPHSERDNRDELLLTRQKPVHRLRAESPSLPANSLPPSRP